MSSIRHLTLGLLAGAVATSALVSSSAQAAVLTDSALSVASGKWTIAVDPASPAVPPVTGSTYLSKGLYSVGMPADQNFSWLGLSGIQTILTHVGVPNAKSGLGSLFTTPVNPASVDGKNLGIAAIDLTIMVRQTSTTGEKGQIAGLLVQGGKYYRTAFNIFAGTTATPTLLNTITLTGLTPSSFGEFSAGVGTSDGTANFASNPDLSPAGGTIQLGYLTGYDPSLLITLPNGSTAQSNRSVVTSWTANITAIPEPTSALAALVTLPLLSRGRRAR